MRMTTARRLLNGKSTREVMWRHGENILGTWTTNSEMALVVPSAAEAPTKQRNPQSFQAAQTGDSEAVWSWRSGVADQSACRSTLDSEADVVGGPS